MYYPAKKLWHGAVSVRDYVVKEAFDKGENLIITFAGEQMTVPHNMLLFGHKNRMTNVSQFKEESYDLIDFTWRPDPPKPSKNNQQALL